MHAIITTLGFVIDSRTYSEADKLYSIFTKDLGLVRAVAQGIRLEKSKLRYHVRENEMGLFSFVRGRDMWRLTNAEEVNIREKKNSVANIDLLSRFALLLRRILHGEEPNIDLFSQLESCFDFLNIAPPLTPKQLEILESLTVLGMLSVLGYVGNDEEIKDCLNIKKLSIDILDKLFSKKTIINNHINKAIKESHL